MGAARTLLLAALLVWVLPVHPSTCLKEAAPDVRPFLVSGDSDRIREAVRAIEERAAQPDAGRAAPWLAAQASMELDMGAIDPAIDKLRRAVSGWLQTGDVAAEVCTRHLLVFALTLRNEPRLALSETLLAEARAKDAGLEHALNRLRQSHVTLLLTLNERLEHALLLLNESRPGETASERINWHHVRGLMLGRLNRHRQAAQEFERVIELAHSEDLPHMVATARLNLAHQLVRIGRDDPMAVPQERVADLLRAVADDPAARPSTRAMALRSLAPYRPDAERVQLLLECEREAELGRDDRRRAICMADRAERLAGSAPHEARALISQALALSDSDPNALWQIQAQRLAVIWATEPPVRAFETSLAAIDGEARLRELQMSGPDRAALIDGLSWDYRRLADLAYGHSAEHPELADRATELLAANRALVLREERTARANGKAPEARAIADRINRAQGRLLGARADTQDIDQARGEILRLEADWHRAMVRPPAAGEPTPARPRLESVRTALAEDEAMLSFLTAIPGQEGPASGWLHVITRNHSSLYRVPSDRELINAASLLQGLPDWREPVAAELLANLSRSILAEALADLGAGIERLVFVPDRGVDRLPLERLTRPDGTPIGIHYAMDTVPSVGVWLDARINTHQVGTVLALADPQLAEQGYRALDAAYPRLVPPRLPGAASEARKIRRLVGSSKVRVLTGREASEQALSSPETANIGLVHFATHALIHPENHDRSAILLSAGGLGDGLLQPREIERLNLAGVGVVLASCASATGQHLDNEGIVSLARSFMIAGAPSVIATRWPVDDQHAQAFFQRFYWHIASGHDQSSALRLARADLHASGYPDSAWAAWVLIGDGRWQPLPPRTRWPAWAAVVVAMALAIGAVARTR